MPKLVTISRVTRFAPRHALAQHMHLQDQVKEAADKMNLTIVLDLLICSGRWSRPLHRLS